MVTSIRTAKTSTWFDEHLTEDNQEFMRKSVAEEYRRQTGDKVNPLKDEPWLRQQWTEGKSSSAGGVGEEPPPSQPVVNLCSNLLLSTGSRRVGLVAVKLGMAPIWSKTGERHAVTMLQVRTDTVPVLPEGSLMGFPS